ncbi:hypothetical protein D770_20645 [Flammeovirgaceae bacterium 311]|nr:hypothetical protein D770_20645 [Flammeovirgaceae bacterium 311]
MSASLAGYWNMNYTKLAGGEDFKEGPNGNTKLVDLLLRRMVLLQSPSRGAARHLSSSVSSSIRKGDKNSCRPDERKL